MNGKVNIEQVLEEVKKKWDREEERQETLLTTEEMEALEEENNQASTIVTSSTAITNGDEIDFGEFNNLERKSIVGTTDKMVHEVWLIKLTNIQQQESVARILANRVLKLKQAFQGQPEQLAIIQDAVIKQEDGIMVMIIAEDHNAIEKIVAEEMQRMQE